MLLLLAVYTILLIVYHSSSLKNNSTPLLDYSPQTISDVLCDGRLNINTATAEQLCLIPEISHKIASNIVLYRWFNGPFKAATDLINVSGVTQKLMERILPYITVEGETL